jgi:hypothetical protein
MKKSKIFLGTVLAAVVLIITTGCPGEKEKDKKPTDPTVKTLTVDASDYAKWVYVSFVQGKVVEISDYENTLSWDMALHRYDVRLNGGTSGKGQGAAVETPYTELSEATTIPTSGYVVDVMDSTMMTSAMPPKYEAQSFNLVAAKWLDVNTSKMPPTYTLSNKVYIFKTAEGKHVKIKFLDFRNAEDKTGHVKFSYLYMD